MDTFSPGAFLLLVWVSTFPGEDQCLVQSGFRTFVKDSRPGRTHGGKGMSRAVRGP